MSPHLSVVRKPHLQLTLGLFAASFLALNLCSIAPAGNLLAASAQHETYKGYKDSQDEYSQGFLLPHQRNRKSLNQIYQFDRKGLDNRIPVVLIPGRAEEFQHNSWWREFHRISSEDLAFDKYFKLYVFLYNSKEELDAQAQSLSRDLHQRFDSLPPTQPLILVTYSLGGVIAREVCKDTSLLNRIDTMISIAVPFHGSPMFDPDWFSKYLNPPTHSPIRRFWDRTLYRGYMFSKSNLTRGLKWDNFDSSKPQFEANNHYPAKVKLQGDQATALMPQYKEYPNADAIRQKTIVYASYLDHSQERPATNSLEAPLVLSKKAVETVLPFYGFTVHAVLSYMGEQLGNLNTYTEEDPQGKNTRLYRYNDGAIPMSSMLFLKPSKKPYGEDIWGLVGMSTVRNVRIFKDLDHLHIGEYTRLKRRVRTRDMVHPEDGKRTPHHWILYDLFHRMREIRHQAMAADII